MNKKTWATTPAHHLVHKTLTSSRLVPKTRARKTVTVSERDIVMPKRLAEIAEDIFASRL